MENANYTPNPMNQPAGAVPASKEREPARFKTAEEIIASAKMRLQVYVLPRNTPAVFTLKEILGGGEREFRDNITGSVKFRDELTFQIQLEDLKMKSLAVVQTTLIAFFSEYLHSKVRVTKTGQGREGTRYILEVYNEKSKSFEDVTEAFSPR